MLLSDLLAEEDLARFRDVRWQAYSDRAADFLHRRFPAAVATLSDEALRVAIRDAALETRQAGLRSERDHLSFLIARIMLGRRFLLNPLYLDLLYAAGWVDDAGRPARHVAFPPLFEQIEAWDRVRASDLTSSRGLAMRFARLYRPEAPTGIAAIHATLPACASAVRPELLAAFEHVAAGHAQAIGLGGPDLQTYACAAVLLGIEPDGDPFLAGIGRALTAHAPSGEEQRLAFGVALRQVLLARIGKENSDAT